MKIRRRTLYLIATNEAYSLDERYAAARKLVKINEVARERMFYKQKAKLRGAS